ncbi:MAG: TetR family transcriptional regulator [Deltaproteobacteria bacterium]|nr:TetR family transcriptional regulator [Deltaproteobacteria bacterium]
MRFNEEGIDNVGIRDLARELDLSPGNVSYWFPRKEDLVRGLLDEIRAQNDARPAAAGHVSSVADLLGSIRSSLQTQLEYRCLTESVVHVARTWPALGARYREVDRARRLGLAAAVRVLGGTGALVGPRDEPGVARLVGTWSLIARFWLAERSISSADLGDNEAVAHYLSLVAATLLPWAARPVELDPWLAGVSIPAALACSPAGDAEASR